MKTKISLLGLFMITFISMSVTAQLNTNYTFGYNGIGTTNPTQRLHVNGNILLNSENRLLFGTNNPLSGHLHIFNSHGGYDNYFDYKGNIQFRSQNSSGLAGTPLIIQADGSIAMGMDDAWGNFLYNTQGYRLAVNGGILCEKIKVISDVPQSDYVFESDYKLMSLDEVKQYIKANKHLPEVPSAAEFKENGYNVGEMDDLLLRKVEELTLYVIELKEELEELKKENK